jgi:hypothetical protein
LDKKYFYHAQLFQERNGAMFNIACDKQRYPFPIPPLDPTDPTTWRGIPLQAVYPPPPIHMPPPQREAGEGSSSAPQPDYTSYNPDMPSNADLMNYMMSMERNNKERYDTLYGQYGTLNTNYTNLQGNYNTLQGSYETLHGDYQTLQGSYTSLHGDYQNLEKQYHTMDTKWENRYNDLHGNFTTLQDSQGRLLHNHQDLAKQYGHLHKDYNNLAKNVHEMGTQMHMRFDDVYSFEDNNLETTHDMYELTRQMAQWNIDANAMPEHEVTAYERPTLKWPFPSFDEGNQGGDA